MKTIHKLLLRLSELDGSDLHLAEGQRPRVRIHGQLQRLEDEPVLTREALYGHMVTLVGEPKFKHFLSQGELDFAWEWEGVARYRGNYLIGQHGLGAVFRLIPESVVPFDELGLPPAVIQLARNRSGLLLVTGATGSGKSTTLASMVNDINQTRACHIVTIEHPIEFVHKPAKSFITQREVGAHAQSFPAALAGAVRQNPDVLLVGELRERVATSLVLTAAEMGVLVMATLHTGSAANSVNRILDMFPPKRRPMYQAQLANCLLGVVSQTLVRNADGKGRTPAAEVLVATGELRTLIRNDELHQIPSAFQKGVRIGCQTLDQSLTELIKSGKVDRDDAILRMRDKVAAATV